jgi:ectoine hydroxylase-related dioxygenase (phytanoyl-CoA dioxygenase family)
LLQGVTHDASVREEPTRKVAATTADLVRTRAYAFDASGGPTASLVEGSAASLARYGFTVLDHVIPRQQVDAIRDEVTAARETIERNVSAIKALQEGDPPTTTSPIELRPVRRVGHPPKPPNDIVWMPLYAQYLASPVVTAVARRVLDDHVRIAQLNLRIIEADRADGTPGGFGAVKYRGRADSREWHTDWPHDLSASGRDNPLSNLGCVRQPFPDVTMCLVMIWYLTDVDADSGATWVVPGSHRDPRNPRGPNDGITVTAPIPGDMQVSAPAGSVCIQDSRSWHSSAMHNTRRTRVAVVNRWCPWWVAVDDYAPGDRYNTNAVCRPLSHAEYLALPAALQPVMRHLCPEEQDTLQQPVLDRAAAADRRTKAGFLQLEEDPESLADANAHVRVELGKRG